MSGVLINALAVIIGAIIGILFRKIISEAITQSLRVALGFCTMVVALKMSLKFESILFVIICVIVGGVIGTALKLEKRLEKVGEQFRRWLKAKNESQFAVSFASSSILFCTGAMAVIGPIEASLRQDNEILFTKSMLDGVVAITFGAAYGIGVAFSSIAILIYQGGIALLAPKLHYLTSTTNLNNLSGVGGVLVLMIGFSISGISRVPVGNFFPAVLLALGLAPFWPQ